jgi:hypothetical protein
LMRAARAISPDWTRTRNVAGVGVRARRCGRHRTHALDHLLEQLRVGGGVGRSDLERQAAVLARAGWQVTVRASIARASGAEARAPGAWPGLRLGAEHRPAHSAQRGHRRRNARSCQHAGGPDFSKSASPVFAQFRGERPLRGGCHPYLLEPDAASRSRLRP